MSGRFMTVAFLVVFGCIAAPVAARPEYKLGFEHFYGIRADRPQKQWQQDLKIRAAAVRCNLCHVPDKTKDHRNEYGLALESELPEFDATAWKDQQRVQQRYSELFETLKRVEPEVGNHNYRYGDLIRNGYLPSWEKK